MWNSFRTVLKDMRIMMRSMDFFRAILVSVAIALPILLGVFTGYKDMGIAIGLGAFWCSPSDISGSKKHMRNGVLASAIMVVLVTFTAKMLPYSIWISLPIIGLMLFLISMISVFGFRASLVSFSGLLALVLSFASMSDLPVLTYSLFVGLGGVWYLILARTSYVLFPKGPTDDAINQTLRLTADFIGVRAKLVHPKTERKALRNNLLDYQIQLGELHETLRNILLSERQSFGKSSYRRKRVLSFVQLVNIYELALANPVNYQKMDKLFYDYQKPIEAFQNLMEAMCQQLNALADAKKSSDMKPIDLQTKLKDVREAITEYGKQDFASPDGILSLGNFYTYQEKQVEYIEQIAWFTWGEESDKVQSLTASQAIKFITPDDYSFQVLKDNLSRDSVIFRHSMRLAVVGMLSILIGHVFEIHNAYWILLTAAMILRPNYGLTKDRAKQRTLGTILGGIAAIGVIFVINNPYVYAALGFLSMVIALTMIRKNYKAGAAFITLNIVFIYALIEPDLWNVLQYRVLDTIIGAGLATLGNIFLWPAWEIKNIDQVLHRSLKANKVFLEEIVAHYTDKNDRPNSYNLARKEAFLSVSELSATFQRMTQEPKSQHQHLQSTYELVSLNHTFLSALASMSTFIQNHPTTAPSEQFNLAVHNIKSNLEQSIFTVQKANNQLKLQIEEADLSHYLKEDSSSTDFIQFSELEITEEIKTDNPRVYERYLIIEQLKWLYSLSQEIYKKINQMEE